ncbi:Eco57I restriction-modification methylase domain-containing protein [Pontibacter populi]|uniref:Eco57I restriction-modification methylase domain-containing protein n=1 Tax=Pontibacter populi TaxID=890055 RepID=A0ABV1RYT8_9BACT
MSKLRGTIAVMQDPDLFGAKKVDKTKLTKLQKELQQLEQERADIEANKVYEGAFEWRFEFPEVLDEEGNYKGFDVVIGNPPYIRQEELGNFKLYLQKAFEEPPTCMFTLWSADCNCSKQVASSVTLYLTNGCVPATDRRCVSGCKAIV